MSYGPDTNREPCPDRIVDGAPPVTCFVCCDLQPANQGVARLDAGGAFAMGALGGSVWFGAKGWYNAPKGQKFSMTADAMRARAPSMGGGFAMWGGLFSTFDCTLQAIRRRDDPINAIVSGGITGGVLAARGGPRAAGKSAAVGAALLAIIEGVGIMGTKLMSDPNIAGGALSREMMKDQLQQQQQMALDQARANNEKDDTKSGWWNEDGGQPAAAQVSAS